MDSLVQCFKRQARIGASAARRGASASSSRRSASTSAQSNNKNVSYPYSPSAVVRARSPVPSGSASPSNPARGIMASLTQDMRHQHDPTGRLTALFSRTSTERVPPGSVLLVETWTNASKTTFSTFSGVLLAVRRRGTATSIVLRNVVQKLGVEVRFNIYSPLLKDVKVVQRALAGKDQKGGNLRRARRAKLYYLRRDDRKLAGIGKAIQSLRNEQQQKQQQQQRGAKGGR